eukprot:1382701-Amphidinium_carterae.2
MATALSRLQAASRSTSVLHYSDLRKKRDAQGQSTRGLMRANLLRTFRHKEDVKRQSIEGETLL